MNFWVVLVLVVDAFLLGFIFLYSLIQLDLVRNFRKKKNNSNSEKSGLFPKVTIQLPVYNERYVVERLIDRCAQLDYPKDLFDIQVLDDSTDQSVELIQKRVCYWKERGIRIEQIRRPVREGFKAGALAYGTKMTDAEFIAIFDADFLPEHDFLKRTIPHFRDPETGVVQTRWQHLNKNYSMLTRLQAFALDAHFTVEQTGRNKAGHFINFNGTAGVWRKSCIESSGGWSSDTLTEDLDLSYRAQLSGWKFVYLSQVGAPAELPASMAALKSQQYRWTKGAAECARKNLLQVWRSKLPLSTKLHASFHLMNSFLFVAVIITSILSVPLLDMKVRIPELSVVFLLGSAFLLSLIFLSLFYWVSHRSLREEQGGRAFDFVWQFPAFLAVSMGMSLHNSIAVIQGYIGRPSPFVRTPKFDLIGRTGNWKGKSYNISRIGWVTLMEFILTAYFAFGIYYGISAREYGLLPYHLLLFSGFLIVSLFSIKHS
jgi:cellulose synthase/poly-beta-1,6-N-acetylglucosamine synthase-like glycosyltransferase